MPCYHPLSAYRTSSGDVLFVERGDVVSQLSLPCGRCIGCRLERSRQWAARLMFERQLHKAASFLTLTYSPENLPIPETLVYSHVQSFLKRLRKRIGVPVRFFCVGEYGEQFARPHYHMILYGADFSSDRVLHTMSKGNPIYVSSFLDDCWRLGYCYIGDVTFESAAYCARYSLKKVTGDAADLHYSVIDPDTGEVFMRQPEFCRMSLKPGIGSEWFDRFSSDVYAGHDYVVVRGVKCKPPRYFDKLFRRMDKDAFLELKVQREFNAYPKFLTGDGLPERLAVREEVKCASIRELRRD